MAFNPNLISRIMQLQRGSDGHHVTEPQLRALFSKLSEQEAQARAMQIINVLKFSKGTPQHSVAIGDWLDSIWRSKNVVRRPTVPEPTGIYAGTNAPRPVKWRRTPEEILDAKRPTARTTPLFASQWPRQPMPIPKTGKPVVPIDPNALPVGRVMPPGVLHNEILSQGGSFSRGRTVWNQKDIKGNPISKIVAEVDSGSEFADQSFGQAMNYLQEVFDEMGGLDKYMPQMKFSAMGPDAMKQVMHMVPARRSALVEAIESMMSDQRNTLLGRTVLQPSDARMSRALREMIEIEHAAIGKRTAFFGSTIDRLVAEHDMLQSRIGNNTRITASDESRYWADVANRTEISRQVQGLRPTHRFLNQRYGRIGDILGMSRGTGGDGLSRFGDMNGPVGPQIAKHMRYMQAVERGEMTQAQALRAIRTDTIVATNRRRLMADRRFSRMLGTGILPGEGLGLGNSFILTSGDEVLAGKRARVTGMVLGDARGLSSMVDGRVHQMPAIASLEVTAENLLTQSMLNQMRFSRGSFPHLLAPSNRSLAVFDTLAQRVKSPRDLEDMILQKAFTDVSERITRQLSGHIGMKGLLSGLEEEAITGRIPGNLNMGNISYAPEILRGIMGRANTGIPGTFSPQNVVEELMAGVMMGEPSAYKFSAFESADYTGFIRGLFAQPEAGMNEFDLNVRKLLTAAVPGLADENWASMSKNQLRTIFRRTMAAEGIDMPGSGGAFEAAVRSAANYLREIQNESPVGFDLENFGRGARPIVELENDSRNMIKGDLAHPEDPEIDAATERIARQQDYDRLVRQREALAQQIAEEKNPILRKRMRNALDKRDEQLGRIARRNGPVGTELGYLRNQLEIMAKDREYLANKHTLRAVNESGASVLFMDPGGVEGLKRTVKAHEDVMDGIRTRLLYMGDPVHIPGIRQAEEILKRVGYMSQVFGWDPQTVAQVQRIASTSIEGNTADLSPFFGMKHQVYENLRAYEYTQNQMLLHVGGKRVPIRISSVAGHAGDNRIGVGYTILGGEENRRHVARTFYGEDARKIVMRSNPTATPEEIEALVDQVALEQAEKRFGGHFIEYEWHSIAPDPREMSVKQLRDRARGLGIKNAGKYRKANLLRKVLEAQQGVILSDAEMPDGTMISFGTMQQYGSYVPVEGHTDLSKRTVSMRSLNFNITSLDQNATYEEAAELSPNQITYARHRNSLRLFDSIKDAKKGSMLTDYFTYVDSNGRSHYSMVGDVRLQDMLDSLMQERHGISLQQVMDVSSRFGSDGLPIPKSVAGALFHPGDNFQIGIPWNRKSARALSPLDITNMVYQPGLHDPNSGISMGQLLRHAYTQGNRGQFQDIGDELTSGLLDLEGRTHPYANVMVDSIYDYMKQFVVHDELWDELGQGRNAAKGRDIQQILLSTFASMPQFQEGGLFDPIEGSYNVSPMEEMAIWDRIHGVNYEGITDATEDLGDGAARAAGRARAAGAATAAGESASPHMPKVSQMFNDLRGLLREDKFLRWGAYGAGAVLALGALRAITHRSKDEVTEDELRGPSNLPGGNPYDGVMMPGMTYTALGLPGYQDEQQMNGVVYQVNARGNYDPMLIQSQIEGITGARARGTIISNRNNPMSYDDIASSY